MAITRTWTVVRFPNGDWSFGGKADDPAYSECEKWQIEAFTSSQAITKAKSRRYLDQRNKALAPNDAVIPSKALTPAPLEPGMTLIRRHLITNLRKIDPMVLRELAEDWALYPRHAILLKRHFLVGLCGHWSQGLDTIMATELTKLLPR